MILAPLRPLLAFVRPYRRQISAGLLLLIGVQGINATIPLVLKWAIDSGKNALDTLPLPSAAPANTTNHLKGEMGYYALMLVVLGVVQWLMTAGMRWYLTVAARSVERDLRALYIRKLLSLPLSFFQKRRVGDLMARATSDLEMIHRFLNNVFRMTLTSLLLFFLSLALMLAIDWRLTLYALAPIPFVAITSRIVAGKMRVGFRKVQEQFAVMVTAIQENLSGIRTLKAFARRVSETERFGRLNKTYIDMNRSLVLIRSLFFPFTSLLNSLAMIVVLWLGGLRIIDGTLTLGAFVAFNTFLIRLGRPMTLLGRMVDEYGRAITSMTRITTILNESPQETEGRLRAAPAPIRGEIEFRNLHFSYTDQPVLEDISVQIPAGSSLGIVGRIGSGKSTLARLVPRLIEAGPGQVLIDGIPVEDYPLRTLRDAIGYVPQETFLFSDTIRENIALGLDRADEDQIADATEVSQLAPDLEQLPQGLDTVLGERGVTLSGGQKQRTALARAVIRTPGILILDDALASVDARTEVEILSRLKNVMASRTTILITHRLSAVRFADRILVLENGRIAEQGSHEELIALNGLYTDMYRRQNLVEELDEL